MRCMCGVCIRKECKKQFAYNIQLHPYNKHFYVTLVP